MKETKAYPVRHGVQLEHPHRSNCQAQSNESCKHCSPASRGGDNILRFRGDEQVTVRVKVRPFLSGAPCPLKNDNKNVKRIRTFQGRYSKIIPSQAGLDNL
jgi:hypothetical protein